MVKINSKMKNLNKKKSFANLDNLKSNFILKKIFINMKKNKSLEILKYNKKLQLRLKLNINDYKEYSQLFTPIKIQLKLDGNEHDEFNKFINISYKEKEY